MSEAPKGATILDKCTWYIVGKWAVLERSLKSHCQCLKKIEWMNTGEYEKRFMQTTKSLNK